MFASILNQNMKRKILNIIITIKKVYILIRFYKPRLDLVWNKFKQSQASPLIPLQVKLPLNDWTDGKWEWTLSIYVL